VAAWLAAAGQSAIEYVPALADRTASRLIMMMMATKAAAAA
jgi:hypothetical protein